MNTQLFRLEETGWVKEPTTGNFQESAANLVLCFSAKENLLKDGIYETVLSKFPSAQIAMCSTSGEIIQDKVLDNSFVAIAIQFEKTKIESASVNIKNYKNSNEAAIALAQQLPRKNLVHVLVFTDGSLVNGSEVVKGLSSQFDKSILVTGGLAGDGAEFKSTLVGLNKQPVEGELIAIGLYGNHLKVKHGSKGGWDIFGLEKRVTKSSANVLVELEGQNALELYKKYLGEEAKHLPGSALLFPLSVTIPGEDKPVVRTILSIDEEEKSMTFAGDVPVGSIVRFMKANFERLTMAAADAASSTTISQEEKPDFALLISCVGRKLILGERAVEEVKAVTNTYNDKTIMAGFYSYGEISPFDEGGNCQLHNQTMTITSFYEY